VKVRYLEGSDAAWEEYESILQRLVTQPGVSSVCDVGGGARPSLSVDYIREHGLRYTVVDISSEELANAPEGYEKLEADVASPAFRPTEQYDVVTSKMVAEHVRDPSHFHRNVLDMLVPGGRAFHFFPTLYTVPFAINRVLPEKLSERALYSSEKQRDFKFQAFYRWCRGPTAPQRRRLQEIGYEIDEYLGVFGHEYYDKIPGLRSAEHAKARWLVRHPVNWLTSYGLVVLRKPQG
jgi:SAM-dependent methyltransferase